MQWNIRRRKTRSERLRETSCCDEWRYGDVVIADLAIVFSETSGILMITPEFLRTFGFRP